MPLKAWLEHYLTAKQSTVADTTWAFYERHCAYAVPHIGSIKLERLEARHVRELLARLERDGLAPRSCDHVRKVLSAALNMAVADGVLARNVVKSVQPPHGRDAFEPHDLTEVEIDRLELALAGERLRPLIVLLLALGLRRSEALTLRWPEVDLDVGVLFIKKAKTKAGRRALPLTPQLVAMLRQQWAILQEERQLDHWKEHGLVFPSEAGTEILGSNLHRWWKGRLRAAGLSETIRIHDLRHTAITRWASAGADPKTMQALAGHADPMITLGIYTHAQADRLRSTVEGAERKEKKTGS
jgi:integrase